MSGSSPSDLAITFRTITRRLGEARGDTPDSHVANLVTGLDRQLRDAAALMDCGPDPASIATAIDALPADQWTDGQLGALRAVALEIGRSIRAVAAANPDPESDR